MTEDDRLADRFTERPADRTARMARRPVTRRQAVTILAALPGAGDHLMTTTRKCEQTGCIRPARRGWRIGGRALCRRHFDVAYHLRNCSARRCDPLECPHSAAVKQAAKPRTATKGATS